MLNLGNTVINVITAIQYIEEHLTEKLDLDIVANAVHYSKYHLHRMFTNTVGLTIHEYVQRRQLTEAAKLLVFSEKPIIEIALLAGYESQQAFSMIFKSMYKQSPKQFREKEEFYPLQLKYFLKENPIYTLAGTAEKFSQIEFAIPEDIDCWMALVRMVIDGFPYLDEEEYIKWLGKCISEQQALIMKDDDIAIGIMAFCYPAGSIDFFGIHPQYRKYGISKLFLDKVIHELMVGKEISITTYREGDKADVGYREEYKKLGFAESELLIEFGYPTQKFLFHPFGQEETENG